MSTPTSDITISPGNLDITSGLYDTEDGITLKVAADLYPRIHLTPQGLVLTGDGTVPPEEAAPPASDAARTVPPDSVYTSGTGRGTPVTDHVSRTTLATALGTFYGARVDVSGAFTRLTFNVTATSLTAGQAVIIACYADDPTRGLPTGSPLWTQSVTVGTTTGVYDVACAHTLTYGQFIGILNPSTNAGTCTVSAVVPIRSYIAAAAAGTLVPALSVPSQGATPQDVSAYGTNAGGSASWVPAQTAALILVR